MANSPTSTVSIRLACASDLSVLLEFRMAMIKDVFAGDAHAPAWDPSEMRASNRSWLAKHFGNDFTAWMAEIDGQIVGSAAILWWDHPPTPVNPGGVEAYVLNVYTRPEWRKRGVARALMEGVLREAQTAGARRIWLRASADGRHLYEEIGFSPGTSYLQFAPGPVEA